MDDIPKRLKELKAEKLNQEFVPATELEKAIDRIKELEDKNANLRAFIEAIRDTLPWNPRYRAKIAELLKGGDS